MPFAKSLLPLLFLFAACKSDAPPPPNKINLPVETTLLLQQNDSLRSAIEVMNGESAAGNTAGTAGKTLLRYKLPTHPVELADWVQKNQPQLLPSGEAMHAETALPLKGDFVFVTASDGYNYHYALLQYKAQMGKDLSWQRVWADTP